MAFGANMHWNEPTIKYLVRISVVESALSFAKDNL